MPLSKWRGIIVVIWLFVAVPVPTVVAGEDSLPVPTVVAEEAEVEDGVSIAFNDCLILSSWPNFKDWADLECSQAEGSKCGNCSAVTLDAAGRVVRVNVSGWSSMRSAAPAAWGNLTQLTRLDFQSANLMGTLPKEWSKLSNLQKLKLGSNHWTGSLPVQWSALQKLDCLNITEGNVTGPLPEQWNALTALTYLDVSMNDLQGSLPTSYSKLVGMVVLFLGGNKLEGTLPLQWTALQNLEKLSLGDNLLTGSLPVSWSRLTNLQYVWMNFNRLSGGLPKEWSALTQLRQLWLSFNNLTGTLPAEWSTLVQLDQLTLRGNQLGGSIPSAWSMPQMMFLQLDNNTLTGEVPAGYMSGMTGLYWLSLSNNRFQGSLGPWQHAGKKDLSVLDVHNNSFSGAIPDLPEMMNIIRFGWNDFQYSIPPLPSQLRYFDVRHNELTGNVPTLPTKLHYLDLHKNNLTTIPSLSNLPMLAFVSLAENKISGKVPDLLRSTELQLLNVSCNRFTGTIPASWSSFNLTVLDLSYNNISGTWPLSLSAAVLVASNNSLRGTLPSNFTHMNHAPGTLDFANNSFSGELPRDWFDDKHQEALKFMDVSGNKFRGGVPLSWVKCNGIRLIIGEETWLQRRTARSALPGEDRRWLEDVCTSKQLFRNVRRVASEDIELEMTRLVERLISAVEAEVQGVVKKTLTHNFEWAAVKHMYEDWLLLIERSWYLEQLNHRMDGEAIQDKLCSNPNARLLVAALWCVVGFFLLVCLVLYLWLRPVARLGPQVVQQRGPRAWILSFQYATPTRLYLCLLRLGYTSNVALYWADIITDLVVLASVSGANWPFGILLVIILGHYLYSGGMLTQRWRRCKGHNPALAFVAFPIMLLTLPLLDCLAFMHAAGYSIKCLSYYLHVRINMDRLYMNRALMETMLESVPSCIVQTVIFVLGNSPSHPLYVDYQVFLLSILFSGLRLSTTAAVVSWEALFHDEGLIRYMWEVLLGLGVFTPLDPNSELPPPKGAITFLRKRSTWMRYESELQQAEAARKSMKQADASTTPSDKVPERSSTWGWMTGQTADSEKLASEPSLQASIVQVGGPRIVGNIRSGRAGGSWRYPRALSSVASDLASISEVAEPRYLPVTMGRFDRRDTLASVVSDVSSITEEREGAMSGAGLQYHVPHHLQHAESAVSALSDILEVNESDQSKMLP